MRLNISNKVLDINIYWIGLSNNGSHNQHVHRKNKDVGVSFTYAALRQAGVKTLAGKQYIFEWTPHLGKRQRAYDIINYARSYKVIEDALVKYGRETKADGKTIVKRGLLHDDNTNIVTKHIMCAPVRHTGKDSYINLKIYAV